MNDPEREEDDDKDRGAQTWAAVERSCAAHWRGSALPALISALRIRGIEQTTLRAVDGMDGVFISIGRTPRLGEQCLRLRPAGDSKIEFVYLNGKANGWTHADWTHIYEVADVEQALDRFLVRAGWFPKGHPFIEGRV